MRSTDGVGRGVGAGVSGGEVTSISGEGEALSGFQTDAVIIKTAHTTATAIRTNPTVIKREALATARSSFFSMDISLPFLSVCLILSFLNPPLKKVSFSHF
jgi:hypothetical protein